MRRAGEEKMSMLTEYPAMQIAPGTYEIDEYDNSSMYLLVGTERALLIDTGVGIGRVGEFVERLCGGLPVDVLLTHSHRDHAGGAFQFSRICMSALDRRMESVLRPWTAREHRLQYARHTCAAHPDKDYPWTEEDLLEFPQTAEIVFVEDGTTFDLGGRKVVCRYCPGHPPDSMAVIDSQTGALFCGDACNQKIGLGVRPIEGIRHATVEEAWLWLSRIAGMDFDKKLIYNGHNDYRAPGRPLEPKILSHALAAMEGVLSGDHHPRRKHIASINADVDIAELYGVELQYHAEAVYGVSGRFVL